MFENVKLKNPELMEQMKRLLEQKGISADDIKSISEKEDGCYKVKFIKGRGRNEPEIVDLFSNLREMGYKVRNKDGRYVVSGKDKTGHTIGQYMDGLFKGSGIVEDGHFEKTFHSKMDLFDFTTYLDQLRFLKSMGGKKGSPTECVSKLLDNFPKEETTYS